MAEWCIRCKVEVWPYCLLPNYVHLIAVPESEDGLRRAIGEAHRRYTKYINFREGWKGHLWQGRFASFPMDEQYLLASARYVELNPVRAKLVKRAEEYPWSSAAAHLNGENDILVNVEAMSAMVGDWKEFFRLLQIMNWMPSANMSEPADHLAGTTCCHYLRKRVAEF